MEDYNITKKQKLLIVFDDMIVDTEAHKELSPLVTKLLFKRKKNQHFTCFYITIFFQTA